MSVCERQTRAPQGSALERRSLGNERMDTSCLKIFRMYINKWKLLLRDATESVYIGGLCNRFLSVFGTLVFRDIGVGWGGLTDFFFFL